VSHRVHVRPLLVAAAAVVCSALAADSGRAPTDEVPRLRAENARLRDRLREERARSLALESELVRLETRWLERELAWRDFHAELGAVAADASAEMARVLALDLAQQQAERAERERVDAEAAAIVERRISRADEVGRRLNALLRAEGFDGFDLFAAGVLAADATPEGEERFGTGPVVVRLRDHRGVLSGSLAARRLHLEASRTGHALTIVLTDGVHREGASERPFAGSVYRIPLRHVDPKPFIEDCPELFDPVFVERVVDDGRWSLPALVLTLDGLLGDVQGGLEHRLVWLGGVVDGELRDVEISVVDAGGRELRRLLADGLTIELHDDHVRLVLRDGLTLRGESRVPFLDGRMRIVLGGADPARWREAHVPTVDALLPGRPVDEAPSDGAAPAGEGAQLEGAVPPAGRGVHGS
jgi:hypothetical protein